MVGGMEFCSSAHEDEVVADGKGHETKRAKLVWTITTVVMTLVMNTTIDTIIITIISLIIIIIMIHSTCCHV